MSNEDEIDLNSKIMVDNEAVTLADLMGVSLDDVAEKRGESFPKGNFDWEVDTETPPHVKIVGEDDKAKAAAVFKLKCINVIGVTDNEFTGDPTSLIGKYHTETMFLQTADSLGYLKAFVKDIGAPYNSNLKLLLSGAAGTRFSAPIMKRKNPNDSDIIYTNINRMKLKKLDAAAESSVAAAAAA